MAARVRVADPVWTNKALTAREVRVGQAGLIVPAAAGAARGGLLAGPSPVGPTSPASTRSLVAPCHVAVSRGGQGTWLVPVEAAVQVDHPAPDSANPRIDLVVARVYDTEAGDVLPADVDPGSGQAGVAVLEVIPGVPGAAPQAPAVPAGATVLRKVWMPAGAAAVLSAAAYTGSGAGPGPVTVAAGAPVPVGSQAERDSLPRWDGLTVTRLDASPRRLELWDAAAGQWLTVGPQAVSYAEEIVAMPTQSADPKEFSRLTWPDPGFPYVPQVTFAFDMSTAAGTRWDLEVYDGAAVDVTLTGPTGAFQSVRATVFGEPRTGPGFSALVVNRFSGTGGVSVSGSNNYHRALLVPARTGP